MKVTIEVRALSARGGGVKTYVWQLIRHLLLKYQADFDLSLIYDRRTTRGLFPQTQEIVVPLPHELALPWWLERRLPTQLRKLKPDLVHYTKAAVPSITTGRSIVTIYDVIPLLLPSSQAWSRRWYWPTALRQAATRSDHIITISEASKRDIVRLLGSPPDKITVTPLAIDHDHFKPVDDEAVLKTTRQKYQLSDHYLLFIGTIEPRKNIPLLGRMFRRIMAHIPHQLVIAGKKGLKHGPVLRQLEAFGLPSNRLRLLNFVPYADLPALYSGADAFIWPSVYEGWGLPPQEAMACGTPVIVSDGGALPEVVGSVGKIIPFTTADLDERQHDEGFEWRLAEMTTEVLGWSEPERQQYRQAASRHVRQFSWSRVADTTADVYHKV